MKVKSFCCNIIFQFNLFNTWTSAFRFSKNFFFIVTRQPLRSDKVVKIDWHLSYISFHLMIAFWNKNNILQNVYVEKWTWGRKKVSKLVWPPTAWYHLGAFLTIFQNHGQIYYRQFCAISNNHCLCIYKWILSMIMRSSLYFLTTCITKCLFIQNTSSYEWIRIR